MTEGRRRAASLARSFAWAGLAVLFVALAVLNSGGYRYGVGDQAFYLPAVLAHVDGNLFPRDRALIEAEDSLNLATRAIGWLSRETQVPLPPLFLALHVLALLLLFGGTALLGCSLYRSGWTVATLEVAMTFRHRITLTGANTLEGYFHPRLLAFAVGVLALAAALRGRSRLALLLVASAGLVHPTTALWFGVLVGIAVLVSEPAERRLFAAIAAVAGAASAWLVLLGPFANRLGRIDERWYALLSAKDYLFPNEWPLHAWLVNLACPALVGATFLYRRKIGAVVPRETGLAAGVLALTALFLASLPFLAARVAFAVQLQTSRVFWIADFAATACITWLIAEASTSLNPSAPTSRRRAAVFAVLALAALARGAWVTFVEHPERSVVEMDLAPGDWHDAMAWIASAEPKTHVLADPGHAWRYGTSVRVSARRDVFLEEVKDTAIAMYSREAAERVIERVAATADFREMTEAEIREMARKYDLHYLVTERTMAFPLAYGNARFKVYRLNRTE
ncbi:MAG: hypothetical protein ACE148_04425 [Vicinamibacterales bacterium]